MEFQPSKQLFVVYYKTTKNEWCTSSPTEYYENAAKLAALYGNDSKVAVYSLYEITSITKKLRKVRKVAD